MSDVVDPWWPLAALAAVQLGDALLCVGPVGFVRRCLVDVGFPRRYWKVLPPLKAAAAVGLVIGIWWRPLAVLTTAALVAYFVIALVAHVRARDFGRNLFLNCSAMLVTSVAAFAFVVAA